MSPVPPPEADAGQVASDPSFLDKDVMNQLQSEQSELLDKIDELRSIGVGSLVELPQIIVCGNQSSGKSSVLEAISRVRFPVKGNVCTRFATEVALRRSPQTRIKVSIEPGESRKDEDECQRLRNFTSDSFASSADLPMLIDQAKDWMGLTDSNGGNSEFSDDVLKLEISGPEQPELTLVDLPGLYTTSSADQSEGGVKVVRKLTEKYMKSSRSIILAIVSAKVDYHIQGVLNLAANFDPQYERTMGIVTHPDILEPGSDEEHFYLKYIQNEKIKLKLGWHVLRNRSFGTSKESDEERDAKEMEFFEQGRWASLPREQVGVETLRHRLSSVLLNHIGLNLPDLMGDIQTRISHNEQELAKMGASRANLQDQRRFLLDISNSFALITNQALNGSYVDDFFGGFSDHATNMNEFHMRRLRAFIRDLNECFADAMNTRGSKRTIKVSGVNDNVAGTLDLTSNPYTVGWMQQYVERSDLEKEIQSQARQSLGIELPGTPNQLLVGSLFRDQSKPWEDIARRHIMNCWTSVEYFMHLVLDYLADKHVKAQMMRHLIAPELEKLKVKLLEKLEELTSYTKSGHPLPVGKSFLTKIQHARKSRQYAALRQKLPFGSTDRAFTKQEIKQASSEVESSSDQFAAAEIIDQMEAYYDTALVTFVDNVAILAIENCLLRPLEKIFTSQTVVDMDAAQVEKIAAEPFGARIERKRLNEELDKLRKGKQTLSVFNTVGPSAPTLPKIGQTTETKDAAPNPRLSSFAPATNSTSPSGKMFTPKGTPSDFGNNAPGNSFFSKPASGTPPTDGNGSSNTPSRLFGQGTSTFGQGNNAFGQGSSAFGQGANGFGNNTSGVDHTWGGSKATQGPVPVAPSGGPAGTRLFGTGFLGPSPRATPPNQQ